MEVVPSPPNVPPVPPNPPPSPPSSPQPDESTTNEKSPLSSAFFRIKILRVSRRTIFVLYHPHEALTTTQFGVLYDCNVRSTQSRCDVGVREVERWLDVDRTIRYLPTNRLPRK